MARVANDRSAADHLVVVRTFYYPAEAHLALSALAAAGIEARLADEHIISMQWMYAPIIGGIKLLVRAEDAAAASDILDTQALEVGDTNGVDDRA
jgi:hypothetical protein